MTLDNTGALTVVSISTSNINTGSGHNLYVDNIAGVTVSSGFRYLHLYDVTNVFYGLLVGYESSSDRANLFTADFNGPIGAQNYYNNLGKSSDYSQFLGFDNSTSPGGIFMNWYNYKFYLQNERNLVLYDKSSGSEVAVWNSGTAVSDRNLKKNIKKTAKKGINIINQLNVVDFQYLYPIVDASNNTIYTGLIAQDVEPIIPEAVQWFDISGAVNGGNYLMHNDKIVPYLIKAIQEQHVIINELLNRVSVLENKGITGITGVTGTTGITGPTGTTLL